MERRLLGCRIGGRHSGGGVIAHIADSGRRPGIVLDFALEKRRNQHHLIGLHRHFVDNAYATDRGCRWRISVRQIKGALANCFDHWRRCSGESHGCFQNSGRSEQRVADQFGRLQSKFEFAEVQAREAADKARRASA